MRLIKKDEIEKIVTRINNLNKKVPDVWDYYVVDNVQYIIERCKNKGKKIFEEEIPYICDGIFSGICGDCKGKLTLELSEKTEDVAKLITYYKNVTPMLANTLMYLMRYGIFVYWKNIKDEKPKYNEQIIISKNKKLYIGFMGADNILYDMNYKSIGQTDTDSIWWMENIKTPEALESEI